MKRRLRVLLVVVVLTGAFLALGGCSLFMPKEIRRSIERAEAFAADHPEALRTRDGIHYAAAGDPGLPTLVLVHGSPGSWTAWSKYLIDPALTNRFHVIAPDRPGYGGTDPGRVFYDFAEHTGRLAALVADRPGRKIWVGHSFGPPVIAQIALDHPDQVDALVLISSAVDPAYEAPRWFNRLGHTRLGYKLMPGELGVANREVFAFQAVLADLEPRWRDIRVPCLVIHGREDRLAAYEEVEFLMARLPRAELLTLEDAGHFIIWDRYETIRDALLRFE